MPQGLQRHPIHRLGDKGLGRTGVYPYPDPSYLRGGGDLDPREALKGEVAGGVEQGVIVLELMGIAMDQQDRPWKLVQGGDQLPFETAKTLGSLPGSKQRVGLHHDHQGTGASSRG